MQAYTTAWRGTGTVEVTAPENVQDKLRAETARRVLPWPSVSKEAVSPVSDGRLVKAHPLVFPTGCGDLRQPRLRTEFSPMEWTQHLFRYFDGRVLSALRGQRAVWAVFNTAMQELSYKSGSLVHKQSNASALTKASLRELVDQRNDLVSKLGHYGADLPSTAMQWKREGNELEWIVRQMSWKAPWTHRGQEDIRTDPRNLSANIHPNQPGHDRPLVEKSIDATIGDESRKFQEKYNPSVALDDTGLEEDQTRDIFWNQSDTESLWDSTRSQNELSDAPEDDDEFEESDAAMDLYVPEESIRKKINRRRYVRPRKPLGQYAFAKCFL